MRSRITSAVRYTGAAPGATEACGGVTVRNGRHKTDVVVVGGGPAGLIYMKLSVDSLHQSDGFVLFCQTLSEYLGRRTSFA